VSVGGITIAVLEIVMEEEGGLLDFVEEPALSLVLAMQKRNVFLSLQNLQLLVMTEVVVLTIQAVVLFREETNITAVLTQTEHAVTMGITVALPVIQNAIAPPRYAEEKMEVILFLGPDTHNFY